MKKNHNPARFSFLLPDMLVFNLIHFAVIEKLDKIMNGQAHFYILLVVFNNMAWLICSQVAGIYTFDKVYKLNLLLKLTLIAYVFFGLITWLFFDLNFMPGTLNFILTDVTWFGVFLLVSRMGMTMVVKFIDRVGLFRKQVVVIGNNDDTIPLINQLKKKEIFYEVKGVFNDDNSDLGPDAPLLGEVKDVVEYAKQNNISEIYSVISPEKNDDLYKIADDAGNNFIKFKFLPYFKANPKYKYRLEFEENIPIISMRPEPLSEISGQIQKRFFDVIFSSLVIIFILSWLMPIIAILIRLESEGPVFFKQFRTGKNNRPFLCLKFRSLKVNDEADKIQVTKNDARYTRIGKFLRRTNLDELPQFFNVLAGDMSVVGSRPHMLKHTDDYSQLYNDYMRRHSIKPGLTGWAQINGYRGEIEVKEQLIKRVEHDIWYIENWNFWLDVRIVLQTLGSTFKGDRNAY
jgi:putative colanic acid biosynthesis UDP-glucose lipid carrier transferase